MIIQALASETYMDYEFIYDNINELATLVRDMQNYKDKELCNEFTIVPDYNSDHTGSVFACLRCDIIDTVRYKYERDFNAKSTVLCADESIVTIGE